MKNVLLTFWFVCLYATIANAQVGIGFTGNLDPYTRFANPTDDIASRTSGSVLLNFGVGPKIWVGNKSFSFSVEGQAVISPLALSVTDYKGLGMVSYPIIARLNFQGLSGLNKLGTMGWTVGGGLQFNKSELFGLKNEFIEDGVIRETQQLYVGLVGYGFGISGFTAHGILKYGFDPDSDASVMTLGLHFDLNIPKMKEISDPASAL